jgi:hypothetical protein
MKLMHKKPCDECPWRRAHPAGWLGGYTAEQFVEQINFDGPPLPCHKTIFDNQPAKAMCAGALIFMKNNCKSAQHPEYGDAKDHVERDTETVFQWSKEFLDHHNDPEAPFNKFKNGDRR